MVFHKGDHVGGERLGLTLEMHAAEFRHRPRVEGGVGNIVVHVRGPSSLGRRHGESGKGGAGGGGGGGEREGGQKQQRGLPKKRVKGRPRDGEGKGRGAVAQGSSTHGGARPGLNALARPARHAVAAQQHRTSGWRKNRAGRRPRCRAAATVTTATAAAPGGHSGGRRDAQQRTATPVAVAMLCSRPARWRGAGVAESVAVGAGARTLNGGGGRCAQDKRAVTGLQLGSTEKEAPL